MVFAKIPIIKRKEKVIKPIAIAAISSSHLTVQDEHSSESYLSCTRTGR
jgi:hypothetical protein